MHRRLSIASLMLLVALSAVSAAEWKTVLVSDDEPGEPLIVQGTIYEADGSTPRAGVQLYVYNTDVSGCYSRDCADESRRRIRGTLVTDAQGRYEFRTIRPASYPGNRIPAHIHYVLTGEGIAERRLELRFQDDPLISEGAKRAAAARGRFGEIQQPERGKDGILRCNFDIRLD